MNRQEQFFIAPIRNKRDGHICRFVPYLKMVDGYIERCMWCGRDENIEKVKVHTSWCQVCKQVKPVTGMQRMREVTTCLDCQETHDKANSLGDSNNAS